jgi:hypothetical protein
LFPKQLIHGDLHYDNVLVENGKVTGLLDFEVCAHDWRAMELAVCLSKVRSPSCTPCSPLRPMPLPHPHHHVTRHPSTQPCLSVARTPFAHTPHCRSLAFLPCQYAGEKEALQYFDTFTTGFAKHGILTEVRLPYTTGDRHRLQAPALTHPPALHPPTSPLPACLLQAEIEVIPELINLRVLSNVVYFVGRAIAKEDGLDALTTRAATYNTRVKWIRDNSATIVDCIKRKMVK